MPVVLAVVAMVVAMAVMTMVAVTVVVIIVAIIIIVARVAVSTIHVGQFLLVDLDKGALIIPLVGCVAGEEAHDFLDLSARQERSFSFSVASQENHHLKISIA